MRHDIAKEKRKEFSRRHPIGLDDAKAPDFYKKIIADFNLDTTNSDRKIAFVLVAHLLHTLPFFVEAISTLGLVAAIIPKQSSYVEDVAKTIYELYASIIKKDFTKETLRIENDETATHLETTIFGKNSAFLGYQYIVLDHGGYFAPQMAILKKFKNIAGIVEHTWNGEIKYDAQLPKHRDHSDIPIFSIGRTNLKKREDFPVAESIISSIKGKILSAEGMNRDIAGLNIGIVGFGHLGKAIALLLKNADRETKIRIVDTNKAVQKDAISYKFCSVSNSLDELLQHSDLIIVATSAQAFTRNVLNRLKSDACVVCVTSRDDLFTRDALNDYVRCSEGSTSNVVKYIARGDERKNIYLAVDGNSVNFIIGSTAHPVLHAVLSSVYISAYQLIQTRNTAVAATYNTIQSIDEKDQKRILSVFKDIYPESRIVSIEEINSQLFHKSTFSFTVMAGASVFTAFLSYIIDHVHAAFFHSNTIKKLPPRLNDTYHRVRKIGKMTIFPEQQNQEQASIEGAFIHLTIIKAEEQREKEKTRRKQAADKETAIKNMYSHQFRSDEDLNVAIAPIELANIFMPDIDDSKLPKKLLIEGCSGIGKSILCQYIAYQWSIGKLWPHFKMVFWISIRNLKETRYPKNPGNYSWMDILNRECFGNSLSPQERSILKIEIENNSNQFLFLLDGYDELPSEAKEKGYLEPAFSDLKNKGVSLITSTPQAFADLPIDRRLEVMGFSSEDIKTYIYRFFNRIGDTNTTRANALLGFLKHQPMIWGIAHIPLQLAMICQLEKEKQLRKEGENQLTMSMLYQRSIKNTFNQFLIRTEQADKTDSEDRLDELQDAYIPMQNALEELAYGNMLNDTIFFSEKILLNAIQSSDSVTSGASRVERSKNISKCGLLRPAHDTVEYYFIHPTFQEYFAAGAIARVLKEEEENSERYQLIKKTILHHRYNPRLQVMWWFVAGHLSNHPPSLQQFFNTVMTEPRDLIGTYERNLLLHCLRESREPNGLNLTYEVVLDPLLSSLIGTDVNAKLSAINTLKNLHLLGHPSVFPKLLTNLLDKDEFIRGAITSRLALVDLTFCPINDLYQALLQAMEDPVETVRGGVATVLAELGRHQVPDVFDMLLSKLKHENVNVATTAIYALSSWGTDATSNAIEPLLEMLQHESLNITFAAIHALSTLASYATPAVVGKLISTLQHENFNIRRAGAESLGMLHHVANLTVVEALSPLLRDESWHVRYATIEAFEKLNLLVTPEVINALSTLTLNDEDLSVRNLAGKALGKCGILATSAVEKFLNVLQTENPDIKWNAIHALGELDSLANFSLVKTLSAIVLYDKEASLRYIALESLKKFDSLSVEIIQIFLTALKEENATIKGHAAYALGMLNSFATPPVVEALLLVLKHADPWVGWSAAVALGQLESFVTPAVIENLRIAFQNENLNIRKAVVQALSNFNPDNIDSGVVDILSTAAKDQDSDLKYVAVMAWGKLNIFATPDVIHTLLGFALSDDVLEPIKDAANESLRKIAESTRISVLFHLFIQNHKSRKYSFCNLISKLIVQRLSEQTNAFYYDKDARSLCYWEKGNLQKYYAVPHELFLLIEGIRKTWNEGTYLPDRYWQTPVHNPHWKMPADLALAAQQQTAEVKSWEDKCLELSTQENLSHEDTDLKKSIGLCKAVFGQEPLVIKVEKATALCGQEAMRVEKNKMFTPSFVNRFCLWLTNNGLQKIATTETVLERGLIQFKFSCKNSDSV